jgi:hypothetical protein
MFDSVRLFHTTQVISFVIDLETYFESTETRRINPIKYQFLKRKKSSSLTQKIKLFLFAFLPIDFDLTLCAFRNFTRFRLVDSKITGDSGFVHWNVHFCLYKFFVVTSLLLHNRWCRLSLSLSVTICLSLSLFRHFCNITHIHSLPSCQSCT